MITVNLSQLELQEEWSEQDPSDRLRSAFALYRGMGSRDASVVYFELEPGGAVATHTDSAEEVVLVLEGTVQVTLEDEQGALSAGECALVPAMVPHSVRNTGTVTARCIGFFAGAHVVSTFEHPLLPSGMRVFDTNELPLIADRASPDATSATRPGRCAPPGGARLLRQAVAGNDVAGLRIPPMASASEVALERNVVRLDCGLVIAGSEAEHCPPQGGPPGTHFRIVDTDVDVRWSFTVSVRPRSHDGGEFRAEQGLHGFVLRRVFHDETTLDHGAVRLIND
jgi:mannose-6-phosphate isomerase-like protein (cupin superfamily)